AGPPDPAGDLSTAAGGGLVAGDAGRPVDGLLPRHAAPGRGRLSGRLLPHADLLSESPAGEPRPQLDRRLEPDRALPGVGPAADRGDDRRRGGRGGARGRGVRPGDVRHAAAGERGDVRLDTPGETVDLSSVE